MLYSFSFESFFSSSPHPVAYFWHIFEVGPYIAMVFGQQIIALLNEWRHQMAEAWYMLHGKDAEMIPAGVIEHDHIERRGGRPLFIKTAHMETLCIGATVNEFVDGSLIAMEG